MACKVFTDFLDYFAFTASIGKGKKLKGTALKTCAGNRLFTWDSLRGEDCLYLPGVLGVLPRKKERRPLIGFVAGLPQADGVGHED